MQVGIIGAGMVGSSTAYALMMRGASRKIIIVDINKQRAEAEANDIFHATPFAYPSHVIAGDYSDLAGCGIVIITAGLAQKPGETRLELIDRNTAVFKQIVPQILKYAPDAILVVATNPVDAMTHVTQKISGLPPHRVIGSGTVLDTARFRSLLGYHLKTSPNSVHAYVLGEHGDSEVLCWSSSDAAGVALNEFAKSVGRPLDDEVKAKIDDEVRNAAYKIIAGKGSTYFGIGGGLTRIVQAIANNENTVMTVSMVNEKIEGVENVALSLPRILGKNGIEQTILPILSSDEHLLLKKSAEVIKEISDKAIANL